MRPGVVFVAILSTLWLPQAAAAQTTATLIGRVVDDSGGVLPGATTWVRF